MTMLLKKRFLSSPFAFGMTLSHYLSLAGPGVASRTTTTTTSSAKASPTKKRACGSRTRPSGCASPRAPTRSVAAEPGQLESLMEWGLSYESRADSRLDAL